MKIQEVDFRKTTTAVLEGFDHRYIDMVIQHLEQRNKLKVSNDGETARTFANIDKGYGLLVLASEDSDKQPFTITTEFQVPSNELAASFMVTWRRWCDKKHVNSNSGLLSLIRRFAEDMADHASQERNKTVSNYAIGLMGAVLDSHPEVIGSMRWSVSAGFVPCLVVANDNDLIRCGVCYGGKYF